MDKKLFKLSSIFSISKYGDVENVRALDDGNINYISTSRYNNGLSRKVTNNNEYKIEKGNCITVGIDGSFKSFYQADDFVRTTNISVLRNKYLNLYNSLYLTTVINKAIEKYYYGVKLKSTGVLENTEILLPCINNDPDWNYMENYIRSIYETQKNKYISSNRKSINLNSNEWKEVKLSSVLDYERGQRYRKEDQTKGPYPYISSSAENNGVDGYVSKGPRSKIYSDCLTLANSGSVGKCFYHEGEFIASDHVHVLTLKDKKTMSKEIGLFLIPIIEMNSGRFLFNKEITEKGIDEIYLSLPYKNGHINYDFIQNYISLLPNSDLI